MRGRVLQDVAGATRGGFVESPENVSRRVRKRQAGDGAPGPGVLVGGAVSLPVVADDQPVGTRGSRGSAFVEHLVDIHPAPGGLGLLGGGKMPAVPVEDRAGRGLTGLDRVQALDGRVGIAAGGARSKDSIT